MDGTDRIAVVAWLWFIGWTLFGIGVGTIFNTPGTGAVWGFIFALIAVFAWPWVMPPSLDRWMYDPEA